MFTDDIRSLATSLEYFSKDVSLNLGNSCFSFIVGAQHLFNKFPRVSANSEFKILSAFVSL